MLDVYFMNSPNVRKVTVMLAETGLPHRLIRADKGEFDVQGHEFRKISPNGRAPAIVDHDVVDEQGPMTLFESGAILIYLAEKTGRFLPTTPRERYSTIQWVMWQMAGLGPSHAQAHHFARYAPEPEEPYAMRRFWREAERLLYVMNRQLAQTRYLACDDYTIADMATWPWLEVMWLIEMDGALEHLPHLKRWYDELAERPGMREGCRFPWGAQMQAKGRYKFSPEAFSNAFGDELHRRARID